MSPLAMILMMLVASCSAFSLAPVAPQRGVVASATSRVELSMMAAKKPVKKVVKKPVKKVVKKVAPKKAAAKAPTGPNPLKAAFSLQLIGGAQGNVANPFAWGEFP